VRGFPSRLSRLSWPAIIAISILVARYPFLYWGMYAGDGEIHLVFGQHAAAGHFFEFNPGEKSSGETSPAFMLVITLLFRLLPATAIALAVKSVNLVCWYGLLVEFFIVARRITGDVTWAWIFTCVAGLMPGSAYNSNVGMETGAFALAVLLSFELATRWDWFDGTTPLAAWRELTLGLLLGVGCTLRPEGVVFAFLMFAWRAWRGGVRRGAVGVILSALPCAILAAAMAWFLYRQTGRIVPGSATARTLIARYESGTIHVGPMIFDPRFALRLLAYFPLTIFFFVGHARRLRRAAPSASFALLTFWTFFILYSLVWGAAHLARYIVFLMPLFLLIAAWGAKWVWEHWRIRIRLRAPAFATLAAILLLIWTGETVHRYRWDTHEELARARFSPRDRRAISDRLYADLGAPAKRPIVLAYVEVQARWWLDDRFEIRSLDGRTDAGLLPFIHDGVIDHIAYLRGARVDFLMETANFNRDRGAWSLMELDTLLPGESATHEGMRFTCMNVQGQRVYRIE
jgi:hypothetical protein